MKKLQSIILFSALTTTSMLPPLFGQDSTEKMPTDIDQLLEKLSIQYDQQSNIVAGVTAIDNLATKIDQKLSAQANLISRMAEVESRMKREEDLHDAGKNLRSQLEAIKAKMAEHDAALKARKSSVLAFDATKALSAGGTNLVQSQSLMISTNANKVLIVDAKDLLK